jgi:dolichol-phosphate mannosyltransferase
MIMYLLGVSLSDGAGVPSIRKKQIVSRKLRPEKGSRPSLFALVREKIKAKKIDMKINKTLHSIKAPKHIKHRKTIVIVPTYNEIENLLTIYRRITRAYEKCDILIIDDGSPDGTGQLANQLAARDRRIKVMHRPGKQGLGTAVIAGFRYALEKHYELIITIDADLSHDPAYIPHMLSLMQEYDLVVGSRYVRDGGMVNWSIRRLLISLFANFMIKKILKINQADCSGGFKCFTADLLRRIRPDSIISKGYVFYVEILYRALRLGAKVKEIPIIFVNRDLGRSKLGWNEVMGYAVNVFRLRWLQFLGRI